MYGSKKRNFKTMRDDKIKQYNLKNSLKLKNSEKLKIIYKREEIITMCDPHNFLGCGRCILNQSQVCLRFIEINYGTMNLNIFDSFNDKNGKAFADWKHFLENI